MVFQRRKVVLTNTNGETNSHVDEMNGFNNSKARNNVKRNAAEDELRRSQSVKQMISSYQQQRLTIKEALCNPDSKRNNKIVFDEDSHVEDETEHSVTTETEKKKSLFQDDDDNEEDDFNFEPQSHFDNEQGQKLLELQSKFKGDKRFKLDERFLPDNENVDNTNVIKECSIEEEKKNEINILEQVLGTNIKSKSQNFEQKCSHEKKMLRFDPSQSNHVQYQITPTQKPNKVKKQTEQNDKEELPQPHVSKDVFYQVHNDLKSTFQSQQGFSLLEQFGKDEDKECSADVEDCEQEEVIPKKNKFTLETNPFRYDSSDDEPDNVQQNEFVKVQEPDNQDNLKFNYEPFFFKEDDFRFQDGSDFVKRVASETNTAFVEQRKNLKHIIKAKVRNINRKSNPFKKKLGGSKKKKLFRMKKALKR